MAKTIIRALRLEEDLGVTDRLAGLDIELFALRALFTQACDGVAAGHSPGPEVSILKLAASELTQRICEFASEAAAEYGGVVGDVRIGKMIADLHWHMMLSRPMTVYGGSSEVQRNIVAKAVLGLN